MTSPQERHAQIAADLREQLSAGTIAVGDPVSITALAQRWGVARRTVANALRTLEADGLLRRYPGLGYYALAAGHPSPPRTRQSEAAATVLERPAPTRHQQVVAQAVTEILEPLLKDMSRRLDEMSGKTDNLLAGLAATVARVEHVIRQSETGVRN